MRTATILAPISIATVASATTAGTAIAVTSAIAGIGFLAAIRPRDPMNGLDESHLAWWCNLEAHPDAVIRLPHQQPPGTRMPFGGEERDWLWQRWVAVDPRLDVYAVRRSTETPVIVLEPRSRTA